MHRQQRATAQSDGEKKKERGHGRPTASNRDASVQCTLLCTLHTTLTLHARSSSAHKSSKRAPARLCPSRSHSRGWASAVGLGKESQVTREKRGREQRSR